MDKRFWAIIGVIVVIFGGIMFFKGGDKANAPSNGTKPTNHLTGQNTTDVTLVEYGDYQCPVCGTHYPVLKQVIEKYKGEITFQFRNLPLSQIHKNAFVAARAAEAADMQGKFWEMHDVLYETQNTWTQAKNPQTLFDGYAKQLGLNVSKFREDAASIKVNSLINADITAFKKTNNPEATPSYFINGRKVQIDPTLASFSKVIDAEIAAKGKKPTN